jgi:hypothetical protein
MSIKTIATVLALVGGLALAACEEKKEETTGTSTTGSTTGTTGSTTDSTTTTTTEPAQSGDTSTTGN